MPQKKVKQLKGLSVSPGKCKGEVVRVKAVKDLAKIKKGNVLVTDIPKLPYNPFTKKAGAIVTNEGGVLSHVANLAREFGTPCVVGTKTATKVLKDGDMVEVDANKGVVKKIK